MKNNNSEIIQMKKIIFVLAITFTTMSFAQEKKWGLEECVNYALENNISVKQAQLSSQTNEQNIESAKGQFLPSVSANASQAVSIGSGFDPNTGNRVSNQTTFSNNFGGNVSYTIFNGFRNTNLYKQSRLNLEASELELQRIKDDISLNVVNSYLNILFNKENLSVAQSQYSFSEKQLGQVKELVDAGVQPRGNLLDIEATLANDEQRVISAENNLTLAKLTLSQLLQLQALDFDVATIELGSPSEQLLYENSNSIFDIAVKNRSEIKSAEKNIDIAKLSTDVSKSGYYPSLTASYGYSTFFSEYKEEINKRSFFNEFDRNKGHRFSLNLNIPIFSRFQNKTAVAKSKIQEEGAMLNLEQAKLTLQSNIERAYTDAKAALKNLRCFTKITKFSEVSI